MKVLSLKLKEDIFTEAEKILSRIHTSRNAYINHALALYNKLNRRKLLKNQFEKESVALRSHSLEILKEMEQLEDEIPE